jgi:hypothetical protein
MMDGCCVVLVSESDEDQFLRHGQPSVASWQVRMKVEQRDVIDLTLSGG